MITTDYVRFMARYNKWQNANLYGAADGLEDAARKLDRGAFFGSIHDTLSHILWGDTIWMSRFDGWEPPEVAISNSGRFVVSWQDMKAARLDADRRISDWAARIVPDDLIGDMSWYSGAIQAQITKPRAMLIMQLFNHQTHHRGQVHAMLTATGAKPGDTDIPFMPDQ